ncbi:MAG: LicD family protein [Mobilitalea sp.]
MKRVQSVDELKAIELEIMKYVHQICENNGLTCFLGGGTLLGAVRHKGFIPWDDDVDVMLVREEYETLIRLLEKDLESPYKVISYRTNKDYYYPFFKVIDSRTEMLERKKLPMPGLGISIDVFPIDGLPKSRSARIKHFNQIQKLRVIFNQLFYVGYSNDSNAIKEKLTRRILNLLAKRIDSTAAKYKIDESEFIASSIWGYGVKETFSKRAIERRVKLEFEKEQFYAPVGYVQYLTHHYGDYMKLPKPADRRCNHNFRAWYK